MTVSRSERWLLLIHQIPPKPTHFRVRIWRRLQAVGAVAIKNSVYVLPRTEQNYEAFQWMMREINQNRGEASICGASFIEGIGDDQVEALFNQARNSEYQELAEEAKKLSKSASKKAKLDPQRKKEIEEELSRLRRRLSEVISRDFFGASSRESADGMIAQLEERLVRSDEGMAVIGKATVPIADLQGRVWVTRRGIHVDRIASAWLIRRFIDPKAKFKFVDAKTYVPRKNELRFDMVEAEFTHEGDLCTFEVLLERTNLSDPALTQIGQIIHDIDIRDAKYGRDDTSGVEKVVHGICMNHASDEDRLRRGSELFDDLYVYFSRKREKTK